MKAVFVHGWGFDAGLWQGLIPLLPGIEPLLFDRGYFGPRTWHWPDGDFACITHSLGTMLALGSLPEGCRALVALNGFDRFSSDPASDRPGWAPRVLDRMIARLASAPEETLLDFRAKCGSTLPFPHPSVDRLTQDLILLRDMDCTEQARTLTIPTQVLQGAADTILSPDLQAVQFAGVAASSAQHPTAGHLLPLDDPQWCAERIASFLGLGE